MQMKIDESFYKEIGKHIFYKRAEKGYSLRQLGKITGLSRTTLENYEMGKTRITKSNWESICNALGMNNEISTSITLY